MTEETVATNVALKHCPFCKDGGKVVLEQDCDYDYNGPDYFWSVVVCDQCECRGPRIFTGDHHHSKEDKVNSDLKAIEAWNTRADAAYPVTKAEVVEILHYLHECHDSEYDYKTAWAGLTYYLNTITRLLEAASK